MKRSERRMYMQEMTTAKDLVRSLRSWTRWLTVKQFAWEHFVYVDWWEFGVAMWILVAAWLVRINIWM